MLITIILLSFNDTRISKALASIRKFDDIDTVRIIVIDGGSSKNILNLIVPFINECDLLISEKDQGIFDALNKGLDNCNSKFIGWLGSDDVFTSKISASDVCKMLENNDLLIAGTIIVRDNKVKRVLHAFPSKFGLAKYGFNNPHFSTFGRSLLLKSERFPIDMVGADIEYFLNIFDKNPVVVTTNTISTLMNDGGFSTQSYLKSLKVHFNLIKIYQKHTNFLMGIITFFIKISYKFLEIFYYKITPSKDINNANFN